MKETLKNRFRLWWHCLCKGHESWFFRSKDGAWEIGCFTCEKWCENDPAKGDESLEGQIDREYRKIIYECARYELDCNIPN